jgi:hypothetical protein
VADAVTEARTTVGATAVATVAIASASGLAGGGGGGGVSALLGAQRINLYGDLAGGRPIGQEAMEGSTTNPMMGRFGILRYAGASNVTAEERTAAVNTYLRTMLLDTDLSLATLLLGATLVHYLVLRYWGTRVNRKYYAARKQVHDSSTTAAPSNEGEEDTFVPLPPTLAYPHFELMITATFLTGLTKSSFVVFGSYIGDVEIEPRTMWTAVVTAAGIVSFLFGEINQLVVFRREHVAELWVPTKASKETDDPMMRSLSRLSCGLIAPGPRKRGAFKPGLLKEPWLGSEPKRTELLTSGRMLCSPDAAHRALSQAGRKREERASWLGDGTGTLKYKMGLVLMQVLLTILISMFKVVKKNDPDAKNMCFACVLAIQLSMASWHLCGQPNDRLKGLVACLVSLLEFVATSLLFASSLANQNGLHEMAEEIGKMAPEIMKYAMFVPLAAESYDALFLPIRKIIKDGKSNGASRKTILITIIFMPLTILLKFFKMGPKTGAGKHAGRIAGLTKKAAKTTNTKKQKTGKAKAKAKGNDDENPPTGEYMPIKMETHSPEGSSVRAVSLTKVEPNIPQPPPASSADATSVVI